MAVQNRLKETRIKKNLNQAALADAVGTCSRTISRLECGQRNPSLEVALRLSQCLNTPVEQLFFLDDPIGKK